MNDTGGFKRSPKGHAEMVAAAIRRLPPRRRSRHAVQFGVSERSRQPAGESGEVDGDPEVSPGPSPRGRSSAERTAARPGAGAGSAPTRGRGGRGRGRLTAAPVQGSGSAPAMTAQRESAQPRRRFSCAARTSSRVPRPCGPRRRCGPGRLTSIGTSLAGRDGLSWPRLDGGRFQRTQPIRRPDGTCTDR